MTILAPLAPDTVHTLDGHALLGEGTPETAGGGLIKRNKVRKNKIEIMGTYGDVFERLHGAGHIINVRDSGTLATESSTDSGAPHVLVMRRQLAWRMGIEGVATVVLGRLVVATRLVVDGFLYDNGSGVRLKNGSGRLAAQALRLAGLENTIKKNKNRDKKGHVLMSWGDPNEFP